jgi:hypothetical protein
VGLETLAVEVDFLEEISHRHPRNSVKEKILDRRRSDSFITVEDKV